MERKIRKIITGIKKIVIILIFIFPLLCYSQNIDIQEEIEGKDLTEKKTKIFYIFPSIPFTPISFPQLPEIKLEEKTEIETEIIEKLEIVEKKEEKIFEKEKKKIYITGKFGNFATRIFDINYKDEKINIGISNYYTENYRENSGFFNNRIYFSSLPDIFNLDFIFGKIELPGPITNPFLIERDFFSLKWDFKKNLSYFNFDFSHNFYVIDQDNGHFFNLNIRKDFENFKLNTEIEESIFENEYNIFSIAEYFIFEREKFLIKAGLKFIEGNELKFLPEFLYKINNNLSIFFNSSYKIPDLWKDVIMENCKELNKEKILPEEIYKGGIRFNYKDTDFEISHSYNKKYLWEDTDNNYLYEPFLDKFYQTSFLFNSKIPINDNLKIFFEIEKNFFEKQISYLPEYKHSIGIELENKKIKFKIWNSFTGKRHFILKDLKSYPTLNFELKYKGKFEIGFGLYNLLDEEYEIFPDYPGEKRRFLFYIEF